MTGFAGLGGPQITIGHYGPFLSSVMRLAPQRASYRLRRMAWRVQHGPTPAFWRVSTAGRDNAKPSTKARAFCCGRSKLKYGQPRFMGDLVSSCCGNISLESMWLKTFGFAGWPCGPFGNPNEDVYWGPEDEWLGSKRYSEERALEDPAGPPAIGPDLCEPRDAARRQTRSCQGSANLTSATPLADGK